MPTVMGQEKERERGGREGEQALWGRVTGSSVQLPAASVINNAIFTHVTQMAANGRVGSSTVRGRRGGGGVAVRRVASHLAHVTK